MKVLLFLVVAVASFTACSSGRSDESSSPPPATVKMDSAGVTVDTSTADTTQR
jgi:uncharacterized lipoprotein YajG